MRMFKRIAMWLAVFASIVCLVYQWVWMDEGPKFFAEDWRNVALLAGVTFVGTLVTVLVMRLPQATRQRFVTISFGAATLAALFCGGYAIREFFDLYAFL